MNSNVHYFEFNGVVAMKKNEKHIGIRLQDSILHHKLHHIAKYEGRSANGHILYLIRQDIERFEEKHGIIPEDTDK
jgi:hypothetical protein